jgi:hypothetical protein
MKGAEMESTIEKLSADLANSAKVIDMLSRDRKILEKRVDDFEAQEAKWERKAYFANLRKKEVRDYFSGLEGVALSDLAKRGVAESWEELDNKYPKDCPKNDIPEVVENFRRFRCELKRALVSLNKSPAQAAESAFSLGLRLFEFSLEDREKLVRQKQSSKIAKVRWRGREPLIIEVSRLTKDRVFKNDKPNWKHNDYLNWLLEHYKDEDGNNPFKDGLIGKDTIRKTIIGAMEELGRTDLILGYNK